ncbi:hypothetical protein ACW6QP_14665 [Salegentibacter sp. HM20]
MKNFYKICVNQFLLSYIIFLLIGLGFNLFNLEELNDSLFTALILSSIFTVFDCYQLYKKLKGWGVSPLKKDLSLSRSLKMHSEISLSEIEERIAAHPDFKDFKKMEAVEGLKYSTRAWYRRGETIEIKEIPQSEKYNIQIKSRPNTKILLSDDGKNIRNINRLVYLISEKKVEDQVAAAFQ